jgi:hypothetical protein
MATIITKNDIMTGDELDPYDAFVAVDEPDVSFLTVCPRTSSCVYHAVYHKSDLREDGMLITLKQRLTRAPGDEPDCQIPRLIYILACCYYHQLMNG